MNVKKKRTVRIIDNATGKEIELPVLEGTLGTPVVDIRELKKELGFFTLDPGFVSTASCMSGITYIDGENGVLLHRGYPIEQLAEQGDFLETAYLLLNGELPTKEEYDEFRNAIIYHTMIHEGIKNFYNGFRRDAHPMAIMVGVVGALAAFYHDSLDINDIDHRIVSAHRLIAKMPTIAAGSYKYSAGQPFVYPDNSLGYVENFLYMMFSVPCEKYVANPIVVDALEKILILHADHEQNASTSTVRLAGSSQANPFACVSSGITALWGPAHGGANEAVLRMLNAIGSVKNIPKFLSKAKDKDDPFRLMGFGHRVYKNHDPRAQILKNSAAKLLNDLNVSDPIFDIALELEDIALKDDYFIERQLYPNVDFYSGVILKAIGIPINVFTVIFSLARTVGWVSHWKEMIDKDSPLRIGRPRQLYTGPSTKKYIPMNKRLDKRR